MRILLFICLIFISGIFWNIVFGIVGKILFSIGVRKIGHKFVAMSIAGDFGVCKKTRKWLFEKCPNNNCDNCKLWTCGNYENNKK